MVSIDTTSFIKSRQRPLTSTAACNFETCPCHVLGAHDATAGLAKCIVTCAVLPGLQAVVGYETIDGVTEVTLHCIKEQNATKMSI